MASSRDVVGWYERKTKSILRKYGPGPIVHFHTGIIGPNVKPETDVEGLRRQLVQSQVRLVEEAAEFWDADRNLSGLVLDFGCGLGGSSIFFAQRHGTKVYALTNVPGHLKYITKFIAQTDVHDKIIPILGDSCAVPGEQIFDGVLAIESVCYVNRESWFKHLAQRVRDGGHIFIADSFTASDEVREPFDRYWLTRIGSLEEYEDAAVSSGFESEGVLDITTRTARFWDFSVLYSQLMLERRDDEDPEAMRLQRSIEWQTKLSEFFKGRKITSAFLRFVHV